MNPVIQRLQSPARHHNAKTAKTVTLNAKDALLPEAVPAIPEQKPPKIAQETAFTASESNVITIAEPHIMNAAKQQTIVS